MDAKQKEHEPPKEKLDPAERLALLPVAALIYINTHKDEQNFLEAARTAKALLRAIGDPASDPA